MGRSAANCQGNVREFDDCLESGHPVKKPHSVKFSVMRSYYARRIRHRADREGLRVLKRLTVHTFVAL